MKIIRRILCLLMVLSVLSLSPLTVFADDADAVAQAVELIFADSEVKDIDKAMEILQPLAESGNAQAQYYLGWIYDYEFGETFRYDMEKEAQVWYKLAADQGYTPAMIGYAMDMFTTKEERADYIEMALAAGFPENAENEPVTCYLMYELCSDGFIKDADAQQKIEWLQKAAEQNCAPAMNILGHCYFQGDGVKQAYEKCFEWELKGAERGCGGSMSYVAWLYFNGIGTVKDEAKAVEWYTKAAEAGYSNAFRNLGNHYNNCQNYIKAKEYYEKAAEMGDGWAMSSLGHLYRNGRGVPKSETAAMEWYQKAGEAGLSWGYHNLDTEEGYMLGASLDPLYAEEAGINQCKAALLKDNIVWADEEFAILAP